MEVMFLKRTPKTHAEILATIAWILLVLSIMVSLIATLVKTIGSIDSNSNTKTVEQYQFGIIQVKDGIQPEIVYDKNTGVMYIISDSGYISPLLDAEGKPQLYEMYEKMKEE